MDWLLLVQNPQLPAFVLGVAVPWVYRTLVEAGLTVPERAKVWLNLALSALVSFLPLVVLWSTQGVPTPEEVFTSIASAMTASELAYRTFLKAPSGSQEAA